MIFCQTAFEHDLEEVLEVMSTHTSTDIHKKKRLDNALSKMFQDWIKQIGFVAVLLSVLYSNQDSQVYYQNMALKNVFSHQDVSIRCEQFRLCKYIVSTM